MSYFNDPISEMRPEDEPKVQTGGVETFDQKVGFGIKESSQEQYTHVQLDDWVADDENIWIGKVIWIPIDGVSDPISDLESFLRFNFPECDGKKIHLPEFDKWIDVI